MVTEVQHNIYTQSSRIDLKEISRGKVRLLTATLPMQTTIQASQRTLHRRNKVNSLLRHREPTPQTRWRTRPFDPWLAYPS